MSRLKGTCVDLLRKRNDDVDHYRELKIGSSNVLGCPDDHCLSFSSTLNLILKNFLFFGLSPDGKIYLEGLYGTSQ